MEAVIILGLIMIIFLLIGIRSKQNEIEIRSNKNFSALKKELLELKNRTVADVPKETPLKATDEEVVQWRPYKAPEQPVEKITEPEIKPTERVTTPGPELPLKPLASTQTKQAANESTWEKWMRNNPDLEKFIGENLINKIGIAVLVLGIAFFVKYAIDKDWIKETGRVSIGIVCGIILIGIAHRLRNSYRSFSSVMAGGGIAVFYFTIAFAFHEYAMFSQQVAFIIMVVITAFAVAISLLYNKIELAVIAVVGGFLVPFLVSNGSNNYVALFTYLVILNTGILIIAYFKKWPLLHVLAFFFTLLIFATWLTQQLVMPNLPPFPYKNALLFASAFYVIFLITVLIHNLRIKKPFKAFDFSLLLLITVSYYFEGMAILKEWDNGAYQGLFNIVLGMINLCLAWYLFKSQRGEKNLLFLLTGLTITFVSLAAPVQLHGHTITMFWSAEAVLLYWLYDRSRFGTFKYFSAIVLVSMLVSLMIDWGFANQDSLSGLPVIFTEWQGIITNIIAVISFGCYAWLLKKTTSDKYIFGMSNTAAFVIMAVMGTVLLYITLIFGVNLYFAKEQRFDIPNAYHQLITYLIIAVILWVIQRFKLSKSPLAGILLVIAAFFAYLFSCGLSNDLITGMVENKYSSTHVIIHWLSDIVILYLFYKFTDIFRKNPEDLGDPIAWLNCVLLVVFFSIECKQLYVSLLADAGNINMTVTQYLKAGLTIVWALFSFVLMWLGMKYKYKTLRIISLSIFSIALLKLFLFDIRNISAGGKIAAFIMLGVLLLIISFMYQRLKKIIIDDENKKI